MSDHIPFEIQSQIMQHLPVKSLIQFRSVSKQWKSLIDSPEFIKNYHINLTNPQHHLLVRYKFDTVRKYTSIIDNNTFPQQKFPLTAPLPLSLLRDANMLSSVNGLLCFYGTYKEYEDSDTRMVVIWNPTVRKSVGIAIPDGLYSHYVIGFGVCPDNSDPKLVKIKVVKDRSMWVVEVFTLSTRTWKTVYIGVPFKSCQISFSMSWNQVFVDGVIYWCFYNNNIDAEFGSNNIISFDLKREKFGEVSLPERLVHAHLGVTKVNESLGLIEYYDEGETSVCGVWTRKDGENKPFTKIYTIKVDIKYVHPRVMGFRKNGEVVLEMLNERFEESEIEVYEPSSGHINGVGIYGTRYMFSAGSYMETLLLLDQSISFIDVDEIKL